MFEVVSQMDRRQTTLTLESLRNWKRRTQIKDMLMLDMDLLCVPFVNKLQLFLILRYEDIVRKPEEQLSKISERFNISVGGMENFLQRHNSAKWKDNKKDSR